MLGVYLMYTFLTLAVWRVLLETWTTLRGTQLVYLMLAVCALVYQGKTGGEMVYDHAVGTVHGDTTSRR